MALGAASAAAPAFAWRYALANTGVGHLSYKHILVAVDLSEESNQVLARARDEAALHNAQLSLIHVVKPIEQVYGGFGAMGLPGDFSGQMATFEREALQQAQAQLKQMGSAANIAAAQLHVLVGHAATLIRTTAEEVGADLIVLGTHGRHGLGLLLGSTANAVLHGVTVDVLAVRVSVPNSG
jgi:universal stress protein A